MLAIFLTLIFGFEVVSSQLTIFENEVVVSPNGTKCDAELECVNCNTGRVCTWSKEEKEWKQFALITCDNTTATPYCNGGTCSKTPESQCKSSSFSCPADGVYPDPTDCTVYYICTNKEIRTNQYPRNDVYDPTTGICKYKLFSSDCIIINCVGREGKKFVYPLDDRIYGICLLGKPLIINRCKDYERYDLGYDQGKYLRSCKTVGIQPLPDDPKKSCGKYILCAKVSSNQYEPVKLFCPPKEAYDSTINRCSKNAPCLAGNSGNGKKNNSLLPPLIINNSGNNNSNNNVSNGNDDVNGNLVNSNDNSDNSNSGNVNKKTFPPTIIGPKPALYQKSTINPQNGEINAIEAFIINDSGNSNSNNNVSNNNDDVNGNLVNGNSNGNNSNSGNIRRRRNLAPLIINNSGDTNSNNKVFNGNDTVDGNLINGNNNSGSANSGNVKKDDSVLSPLIINNSGNNNSDNNVLNGNDDVNGNLVNGNNNGNNSNSGNVDKNSPAPSVLIINNSGNDNNNNSVSNGADDVNGNLVNGNNNGDNSNSGNVDKNPPAPSTLIINNSENENQTENLGPERDIENFLRIIIDWIIRVIVNV